MDLIKITGLREMGVHGVLAEERTRRQPFEVDIELHVDLAPSATSDELDDTVDYGAVCEAISRVISAESYKLLERLAGRIVEVCAADARVEGVSVDVRKLHPPVPVSIDHVSVHVERRFER